MTNWITQHNYAEREKGLKQADIKKDPEKYGYTEDAVVKITVPGQSVSVKEILNRYEKGRPIPQE